MYVMKVCGGSAGLAPVNLNLSIRYRGMLSAALHCYFTLKMSLNTSMLMLMVQRRGQSIIECAAPLCVICSKRHPVVDDLILYNRTNKMHYLLSVYYD
jgi:hypothetical protein